MATDDNTNTESQPVLGDQPSQVQFQQNEQQQPPPKSSLNQDEPEEEPYLDIPRHLRYWKMCIRAPLPHVYLSNESSRLALAYFIVNSITILTPPPSQRTADTPEPLISREDKKLMRKWVLHHQHPTGGFVGTSSMVFPLNGHNTYNSSGKEGTSEDEPEHHGLANISYTLFALQLLALLADEEDEDPEAAEKVFEGVNRKGTLRWLKSLQREDGSFGEALSDLPGYGRFIAGGYDMRYCYIATAIRWILRGDVREGDPGWVEDIDVERLRGYILSSQTYDRGFAGNSQDEAHAGYAYCAIAALTLLDQDDLDDPNFLLPPTPSDLLCCLDALTKEKGPQGAVEVAFNGRTNKTADTCYFWWVGGALANLGWLQGYDNDGEGPSNGQPPQKESLVDRASARRFLLTKMQHRIGGFGKSPGSPPDLYHSFFGLAVLGLLGHEGERDKLRRFDAGLAVPKDVVGVIEKARKRLVERDGLGKSEIDDGREGLVEMGLELRGGGGGGGERPKWLGECGY
ncbi:terpenoid cyclases/protein prenyltransferase alpha-alpha toroid [Sordaria brevicollis]|uniref:Terpenoid cyclases/protein prenyltransferase alpha-alpha toroid n=1 Tax=Sordaria brevicollis TaxID=83679 RepID=A0AAE0PIC0_SORBR|nr:terpenoid cyclases/protein prenyltransferase alpha-alpha toroid [Sordaria brevicollis]